MSDTSVMEAPAKPRTTRRKPKPTAAKPPKPVNEFAGITVTKCCTACTPERCVISTTPICKHPCTAPANGCGPITIANREKALKVIKRQKIEAG